jgi:hypothetical protein
VHVTGTLAAPRFGVSPEAAAAAGLGAFLSLQRTPDRGLQGLAGALGLPAEGAGQSCATALTLARDGRQGLVPAAEPAPAPAARQSLPREVPQQAEELLRGLFGRGR